MMKVKTSSKSCPPQKQSCSLHYDTKQIAKVHTHIKTAFKTKECPYNLLFLDDLSYKTKGSLLSEEKDYISRTQFLMFPYASQQTVNLWPITMKFTPELDSLFIGLYSDLHIKGFLVCSLLIHLTEYLQQKSDIWQKSLCPQDFCFFFCFFVHWLSTVSGQRVERCLFTIMLLQIETAPPKNKKTKNQPNNNSWP